MSKEQFAAAAIADMQMEQMRRYVVAGRRFVTLPEDLLSAQWVNAYRHLVSAPEDLRGWDVLWALQSEFKLRGLKPPRHLVKEEFARFWKELERLRRDWTPDPAVCEEVGIELAALRERLQRPKH